MMTNSEIMRHALNLAERGRGHVEPNPMVGAVVVREGVIVGEGWHQRFGGPHAEIEALNKAGPAARGATLFVTLEPCCHHGKTPPCTDAVLRAGIARVIVAMPDPFPRVDGRGIDILRSAGVTVEIGVEESLARRLNRPYLKRLRTGCPWVIAKWAMTLDGKIATRTGHSQWISGPASRALVHERRGQVDAIMVGAGTVRADDPQLTARGDPDVLPPRIATRVIVTTGNLPLACLRDVQILRTHEQAPVLVVTPEVVPDANRANLRAWERTGCEVLALPTSEGRIDVKALLVELGRRQMTNLLVEGGAGLLGTLRDAGEIDEVMVFIAPVLVGGEKAPSPMAGLGVETIGAGLRLSEWWIELVESDVVIRGSRVEA